MSSSLALMALINFAPSAPSTMRWSHESVSFIIWRTTILPVISFRFRPGVCWKPAQDNFINGFCVLQRLFVFDRLRFNGEGRIGITKTGGVGSQRVGGIREFAEL